MAFSCPPLQAKFAACAICGGRGITGITLWDGSTRLAQGAGFRPRKRNQGESQCRTVYAEGGGRDAGGHRAADTFLPVMVTTEATDHSPGARDRRGSMPTNREAQEALTRKIPGGRSALRFTPNAHHPTLA